MSIKLISRCLSTLAPFSRSSAFRARPEDSTIAALSRLSLGSGAQYNSYTKFPTKFVGIPALKGQQLTSLNKLEALSRQGLWKHLQKHTEHPYSSFDWWMFPIDRPSDSQGFRYALDPESAAELLNDKVFIKNYRQGVTLVANSWGWDLINRIDYTNEVRRWTGYDVRLGKMLHSLKLFQQNDLYQSLVYFIDKHQLRPSLDAWIHRYLP